MNCSIEDKRKILDSAKGRIFSCKFVKKDGSVREMTAKAWMEKSFTYGSANARANTVAARPEYYTAAEIGSGEFRNINLSSMIEAKVNGVSYNFGEES